MKSLKMTRFDMVTKPEANCKMCAKEVSPRRAIVLLYPTITLCPSCHADNIDRLDAISTQYDDHKVCVRKKTPKFDYHFTAADLWGKRQFRASIASDTQAVTHGRANLKEGESLVFIFNATTNTKVSVAGAQ